MKPAERNVGRKAFTVIELLVVVSILAILVGLLSAAWLRARHTARVIKEGVALKSKLDDAIVRGAVKAKDYDAYRQQIQRQINSGLEQRWSPN